MHQHEFIETLTLRVKSKLKISIVSSLKHIKRYFCFWKNTCNSNIYREKHRKHIFMYSNKNIWKCMGIIDTKFRIELSFKRKKGDVHRGQWNQYICFLKLSTLVLLVLINFLLMFSFKKWNLPNSKFYDWGNMCKASNTKKRV